MRDKAQPQADQATQLSLLYFADPMCSWCYGYAPVIATLAQSVPVTPVMGGLRPGETRPMNAHFREEIHGHWKHVEQASGQPFDYVQGLPDGFVYDTEPACRAVVTAGHLAAEKKLPYLHSLHQAFYAQARDVKMIAVLVELAVELGLDGAEFARKFMSRELQEETAAEFERARDCGVNGYPTLLLQQPDRLRMISVGYEPLAAVQEKLSALGLTV